MGAFNGLKLSGDQIVYRTGMRKDVRPVAGVQAWVESAGDVDRRLSLTRTAAGGVMLGPVGALLGAVAKKKVDDRQMFVMVQGPDFGWAVEVEFETGIATTKVNQKRVRKAQELASAITAAGRR